MNPDFSERPVELIAVINSFNRRSLLEPAVASLTTALRAAEFRSALVVFEAGSTDGSREFLETWAKKHPSDHLVAVAAKNDRTSFSDGVNAAAATALDHFPTCRWLFLYETDNFIKRIKPLDQAVLLLQMEPRLAAVGFTVTQHDSSFYGYGMRFPTVLSLMLGQNLASRLNLHAPNDSPWHENGDLRWRTCDVVYTSPLLVRREAWEQSGGFDAKNFPFSDSDLDWAWRCRKFGWQMAVLASRDVVHDNLRQPSAWSATRVPDFHRNRFRLLRRHRGHHVALIKPLLFLRHCGEIGLLSFASIFKATARRKLRQRMQMLRIVWNDYS